MQRVRDITNDIQKSHTETEVHMQHIESCIRDITDVSFGVCDAFIDATNVQAQFVRAVLSYFQNKLSEEQKRECGRYLMDTLFGSCGQQMSQQQVVVSHESDQNPQTSADKTHTGLENCQQQQKIIQPQPDAQFQRPLDASGDTTENTNAQKPNAARKPVKPQNKRENQRKPAEIPQKPESERSVLECLTDACAKLFSKAQRYAELESHNSDQQRAMLHFADQLNGQICRSDLPISDKQQLWNQLESIVEKLK